MGSIPSRVNARKSGIDPKLARLGNEANKLSKRRCFEHVASSFSLSDFARLLVLRPSEEQNKTIWRKFSIFYKYFDKCSEQASTYGNDFLISETGSIPFLPCKRGLSGNHTVKIVQGASQRLPSWLV